MKKKIDGRNNKKAYESHTKAKTVEKANSPDKKARLKRLRTISVIICEK